MPIEEPMMYEKLRNARGFSLIELMIALVIVAIIAAIALPNYKDSVVKSRRTEAKAALLDLQNRMERFFIDHNSYANACITGVGTCTAANSVLSSANTENGHYRLSITSDATTYTLKADPQGGQASSDTKCRALTLTNAGIKGIAAITNVTGTTPTGTAADCW
jgi:type IV pilus assembly protein PilE